MCTKTTYSYMNTKTTYAPMLENENEDLSNGNPESRYISLASL